MFFTYILRSQKDDKLYIGYTSNIDLRFQEHQQGLVTSTRNRRPLKLVYYEAFLSETDARKEEKYLKTGGHAHNDLKLRLKESLTL